MEEFYNGCINHKGLYYLYGTNYLTLQFDVNNSQLHTAANTLLSNKLTDKLAECISPDICYLIKILLSNSDFNVKQSIKKVIQTYIALVNRSTTQLDSLTSTAYSAI